MQKRTKTAILWNLQVLFFKPYRNNRAICGPAAHFPMKLYAAKKESCDYKSEKKNDVNRQDRACNCKSDENVIILQSSKADERISRGC